MSVTQNSTFHGDTSEFIFLIQFWDSTFGLFYRGSEIMLKQSENSFLEQ